MSDLKAMLAALSTGRALAPAEAEAAFAALMDGVADDAQIGAFLMALKMRGEAIDEIVAGARALRARAQPVDAPPDVIDTCGTGGDGANTYNISTAAALIAAGAGAKVAKHGNRAVSSKSGSSQVLAALGVNIEAGAEVAARCIREAGVGFLYAPSHHAAMRHVASARRSLGMRSVFNLLGPLSNPAGATRQLVGVYDAALAEPMAKALNRLGATRAWVVHGEDGLDELTTTAPTHVVSLKDGALTRFTITPETTGLPVARLADLAGGGPERNAAAILSLLEGAEGPFRDIAVLNAGAALVVAGHAAELREGVALAAAAIDSGRARTTLSALVAVSNEPAP